MKRKRPAIFALKYFPVVMTVMMIVHAAAALYGFRDDLAEAIAGTTVLPAVIILLMSHAFGFCWLHKLFTLYVLQSSLAMNIHRFRPMQTVDEHRLLFLIEGVLLLVILFVKVILSHKNHHHYVENHKPAIAQNSK